MPTMRRRGTGWAGKSLMLKHCCRTRFVMSRGAIAFMMLFVFVMACVLLRTRRHVRNSPFVPLQPVTCSSAGRTCKEAERPSPATTKLPWASVQKQSKSIRRASTKKSKARRRKLRGFQSSGSSRKRVCGATQTRTEFVCSSGKERTKGSFSDWPVSSRGAPARTTSSANASGWDWPWTWPR